MKKNKKFSLVVLLCLQFSLLFSCVSTGTGREASQIPERTAFESKNNPQATDSSSQTEDVSFFQKSIETTISEIDHSFKNDSLKALWRTYLLLDSFASSEEAKQNKELGEHIFQLFCKCFDNERETLSKLKEDDLTVELFVHYTSSKKILDKTKDVLVILGKTEREFNENFSFSGFDEVAENARNKIFVESKLQVNSNSQNESVNKNKIAPTIEGTVTVWVDLGTKLMNGKGFANKTIGSAFFIDDRGYLITNYHVISSQVDPKYEGVSRLFIKIPSEPDKKIPAKVVGYDESLDIALLKTEISPKYVFSLGSSSELEVGDSIYAIGSPVGLEQTLTRGIVSAQGRQLFSIATVMQIDAALNQGNSGGPIIDSDCNVQAIAFAGLPNYENLNFAIPVEYLKMDLPYLFCGEVQHSYIGCYGKTKKSEDGKNLGVEVLWLEKTGNASKAGIQKDDVITKINGKVVDSLEALHKELVQIRPHSVIDFEVLRENKIASETEAEPKTSTERKNFCVYTDVRSKYPLIGILKGNSAGDAFYPIFGLELKRSSTISKSKFTVQSVVSGSIADEMDFSELDPIQVLKTGVQNVQESSFIIAEVYSKKKMNGYLDTIMVLASPSDSEFVF